MVEAVRAISDPVARMKALEELKDQITSARRDVSVLRSQTVNELRRHVDDKHPDGWTLKDIGELIGKPRGTVQYIAEGRGLARENDEPEADRG